MKEYIEKKKEQEFLRTDLINLYNKLKYGRISSLEAEQLYQYLKRCSSELPKHGLTIEEIKKLSTKALGHTSDIKLRTWLVEIEYL